jgi:hypothetical protein
VGTVVYRKERAYVAEISSGYTEAIEITSYYEIHGYPPEGSQGTYQSGGMYVFENKWFPLVNGEKTLPAWVEKRPIPPPRVRAGTEVRWLRGGWEKYSQKKGWISG